MKKVAIAVFGTLALLFIGAALFLPSSVRVERKITIAAPPEAIYPYLGNLRNWEKWSPWIARDPKTKLTYTTEVEGVGAGYSWESESQGSGKMVVTRAEPPKLLEGELDFGDQGTASNGFSLAPAGEGQTEVTWFMVCDLGNNPIGKLFGLAMDSMIGPDFEDGLQRLKKLAESTPPKERTP